MSWKKYVKQLRKPQISALKVIDKYFASSENKSSLIHMPTGSGKSGIISMVSNVVKEGCILIVTPRVSLKNQLYNDVKESFFNVIKKPINPNSKIFEKIEDNFIIDPKKNYSKHVFVTTIQKIEWLKSNLPSDFQELVEKVSLLIFDEGHYEPAYSWSQTVRKFTCQKILFTATPFRNDHKKFETAEEYNFAYSYSQGVKDKYLRKIEFIQCPSKFDDKIL